MLVTVTGGSGSGKSAYAEQTAVRLAEGGRLLYLATMMRDGAGAQERIRRHRALRSGKGFLTIEKTDSLCELDPGILQGATVHCWRTCQIWLRMFSSGQEGKQWERRTGKQPVRPVCRISDICGIRLIIWLL